ncbi:phage distal tail protein [Sinomonas cyclohexanicum]|uniref:phage distal tail protein n=1 Tax=Sinomonas cyclohexanicum TaxID=322009 RepID=UPI001E3C35E3|nr:phage tail domain-containing protein [Corynebacterium cyclohexanicum]
MTSASCGLQNPTSGGTFPATFNYTFGASSGGSITLNNTGLYNTPPYLVVKGPCQNPAITNNGTGQYIRLNTTLTGADTLAIDTQSGTVTLNGTANRNNIVDPTSTFFTLPPGPTSLQFSSSDSAAVTGTLTGYIVPAYSTI